MNNDKTTETPKVHSEQPPVQWAWILLPPLLIPISWILFALPDLSGFPAQSFIFYPLIGAFSFLILLFRLLKALFKLRWDRRIVRTLLTIFLVFVSVNLFQRGVKAVDEDLDLLAQDIQRQCDAKGHCPVWPIKLPDECIITRDQRFSCLRKGLRVSGWYSLMRENQQFSLGYHYWVFSGISWIGGVGEDLSRQALD